MGPEPPPSANDLDVAFVLADADQSGLVDLGEFTKLYKLIKVEMQTFFSPFSILIHERANGYLLSRFYMFLCGRRFFLGCVK